jgi:predicted RNase H-like nuclease (RuvC/YqgF family)
VVNIRTHVGSRAASTERRSKRLSLAVLNVLIAGSALAQTAGVDSVIGEQVKAEEAAQASQKRVAQLDDESTKMLSEYRQMNAEAQSLTSYNQQLAEQVRSQSTEVETMTRQLAEIEVTSREVMPMMQRMLATLEQFVALDLPFLVEERTNRVAQLKEMMTRADVSISEKYRRIVEAYQIETEYGRTVEAYRGNVGDKTVDFLRTGRIALMFLSLDGREAGYWDANEKTWKTDNDYRDAMIEGLKVAKKQAAPDFIEVAVPAAKEVG